MTYALIAFFLATGDSYVERTNLSLQQCAAHAAITRQNTDELYQWVGEVQYRCVEEVSK
jgi:hypothetical protein